MDVLAFSILAAAAGFAFGYGVRHAISQHRHAVAMGASIICDKEHTFRLVGPHTSRDSPVRLHLMAEEPEGAGGRLNKQSYENEKPPRGDQFAETQDQAETCGAPLLKITSG